MRVCTRTHCLYSDTREKAGLRTVEIGTIPVVVAGEVKVTRLSSHIVILNHSILA